MASKITKTNAMRLLDKEKISYKNHEYSTDGGISALDVAISLGESTARLFKTLVTTDNNKGYFVFCIPAENELDLKAGAKAAGVKKIEMLKQKDLFKLTGYVHGGCSPIGMKKLFPTFINESALEWETIYISGGKIGLQIEMSPKDLVQLTNAESLHLVK